MRVSMLAESDLNAHVKRVMRAIVTWIFDPLFLSFISHLSLSLFLTKIPFYKLRHSMHNLVKQKEQRK